MLLFRGSSEQTAARQTETGESRRDDNSRSRHVAVDIASIANITSWF